MNTSETKPTPLAQPEPVDAAGCAPPDGSERVWIAQRVCRARTTILVKAPNRREAQRRLDDGEGEGVDIFYYNIGKARIMREDRVTRQDKPNAKLTDPPETRTGSGKEHHD